MKRHHKLLLVIAFSLSVSLQSFIPSTVFGQDKTFAFTFAGVLPKGSLTAVSLDLFAERVNKESGGRIAIKTIHGTALGGERDMIESIQLGSLDGGCFGSVLASFYKPIDIFNVPYLFLDDYWETAIIDGKIGTDILKGLETIEIKGLGWYRYGARGIGNIKRQINTPEDIKGLKIRTIENDLNVKGLEALGAIPVTMSTGDALMAMRQQTIDGIDFPQSCLHAFKIDEMVKFFSFTWHTVSPVAVIMNLKKFKSLPPDLQRLMEKIVKEVGAYHNQTFLKKTETEDRYESYKHLEGKIKFADPDRWLFREKCIPFYTTLRKTRPDLAGMMETIMKMEGLDIKW